MSDCVEPTPGHIHACRGDYCIENALADREAECVSKHATAQRIIDWLNNPNRKPAAIAFTEGPDRQIAYVFERKEAEVAKLRQWLEIEHRENVQGLIIHRKDNPYCPVCIALSGETEAKHERQD